MEKEISFSKLEDYNDSNSLVWLGLLMGDETIQPMNEWFHEIGLIKADKNLVDWRHISGNIRGEEGRSDILLIFDNEESQINPMIRLQVRDLKWTSDFTTNFRKDYYYE